MTIFEKIKELIPADDDNDKKSAFRGSWKNLYLAVLINLALLIILMLLFSETYQ